MYNFITPIQILPTEDNKLYIKRDDLIPFSFGGNKARKAFLFFKEIDQGDYNCVVTYGSSSSNHCRIVANLCAQREMPCFIISPEEASQETFNSKMMDLFGAQITVVPVERVHDTIETNIQKLKDRGFKPYFIPGGGHGNIGTQAYVDCYQEIKEWEQINKIQFDYIFFASGTGTTQAGLVCGKLINGDDTEIIGISIARKNPYGSHTVIESVEDYIEEKHLFFTEDEIQKAVCFLDDYTGSGYGRNSEEIRHTIDHVMKQYGIPLDETYTGKAFNGMMKYIERKKINGKNILFIHTGGTPLFFDYLKEA